MKTQRPVSGEQIPAGWFGDFWDDVHACELSGGPGVRVNRTPNGTTVTAFPSPAGEGKADVYNGYFIVHDASEKGESGEVISRKVKIIDGGNPDSGYCGVTDLGNVEKTEIDFTLPASGTSVVYLLVNWQTDKYVFSFQIGGDVPKSPTGFCVLADINTKGEVRQLWKDGVIYFAERYYT